MRIRLKTFPHHKGHSEAVLELKGLNPEQIFGKEVPAGGHGVHPGETTTEYTVVVDGHPIKDWDELLEMVGSREEDEVEVVRFKPIIGG